MERILQYVVASHFLDSERNCGDKQIDETPYQDQYFNGHTLCN